MEGRYQKDFDYEFETSIGITRKMKLVRSTQKYVWFLYKTEKTRRVIRIERKDKKWKERIKKIPKE